MKSLIRIIATALTYALVLAVGILASCLPGNVECKTYSSTAEVLLSESLIVATVCAFLTLSYETMTRFLRLTAPSWDVVLVLLLSAPVLAPFCWAIGCSWEQGLWMICSVLGASTLAAVVRRVLLNIGK